MTEPESDDFGTIVLYIFFCLVVAAAVGASIVAFSPLTH
jgi:hypothetical protein